MASTISNGTRCFKLMAVTMCTSASPATPPVQATVTVNDRQITLVIHTPQPGPYPAGIFVDENLMWWVGEGAVAAIYFANRLVQLPLALFGTASAQASLPALSEQAAHEDFEGFRVTMLSVIRMVGFVTIPAAVGLMILATPIVRGLFERGAFDHRSTVMTAQALACYAIGLLGYSISKVVSGSFYALRDTWTPVKLAGEAIFISVPLSLALMWPLGISGLALAASLTNLFNAYRLAHRMERRLRAPVLAPVAAPLLRMLLASLVMGLGCWLLWRFGHFDARPRLGLMAVIASGLVFYVTACAPVRVPELSTARRWLSTLPLPSVSE